MTLIVIVRYYDFWQFSWGLLFALGGVIVLFSFELIQTAFQGYPSNLGGLINGLPLAFIGFLAIGIGLWSIIRDAWQKPKQNTS